MACTPQVFTIWFFPKTAFDETVDFYMLQALSQKLSLYLCHLLFTKPCEIGTIIFIFSTRKLRQGGVT